MNLSIEKPQLSSQTLQGLGLVAFAWAAEKLLGWAGVALSESELGQLAQDAAYIGGMVWAWVGRVRTGRKPGAVKVSRWLW